jgi:AcrR family transcriptional regulator
MFRDRSLNRAEIATDLAIPLLAEHGWAGLTLAAVAARGNMRRQSVTQWFGSGDAFREQVAWRYANRWVALLSSQLAALYRDEEPDAATVARLLLPRDDDGVVFARIWLATCEAGRSDAVVAAAATFGESEQLSMVGACLSNSTASEIRVVNALVTGLRHQLTALVDPLGLGDAYAATEVLRRSDEPSRSDELRR